MNSAEEKIEKLNKFVSKIYDIFEKRPGMLGTPEEVCAVLAFLDDINQILV